MGRVKYSKAKKASPDSAKSSTEARTPEATKPKAIKANKAKASDEGEEDFQSPSSTSSDSSYEATSKTSADDKPATVNTRAAVAGPDANQSSCSSDAGPKTRAQAKAATVPAVSEVAQIEERRSVRLAAKNANEESGRWDDWVPQDRLRKLTDENRELASDLRREAQSSQAIDKGKPVKTTASKKRAHDSEFGSGRGSEDPHGAGPSGRGGKRARGDNDIEKVGSSPRSTRFKKATFHMSMADAPDPADDSEDPGEDDSEKNDSDGDDFDGNDSDGDTSDGDSFDENDSDTDMDEPSPGNNNGNSNAAEGSGNAEGSGDAEAATPSASQVSAAASLSVSASASTSQVSSQPAAVATAPTNSNTVATPPNESGNRRSSRNKTQIKNPSDSEPAASIADPKPAKSRAVRETGVVLTARRIIHGVYDEDGVFYRNKQVISVPAYYKFGFHCPELDKVTQNKMARMLAEAKKGPSPVTDERRAAIKKEKQETDKSIAQMEACGVSIATINALRTPLPYDEPEYTLRNRLAWAPVGPYTSNMKNEIFADAEKAGVLEESKQEQAPKSTKPRLEPGHFSYPGSGWDNDILKFPHRLHKVRPEVLAKVPQAILKALPPGVLASFPVEALRLMSNKFLESQKIPIPPDASQTDDQANQDTL